MEGEHGIGRFGGSLRVESVQALADRLRGEIPARYLMPETEGEEVIAARDGRELVPVIDLGKLVHPDHAEEEAAQLHSACAEWGIFLLVNHGVSEDIIDKMKEDITDFFMLPSEEKERVRQLPEDFEGYGGSFVYSEDQKLDWDDILYLCTLPPHFRVMNLWPSDPPSFRETLCNYSNEVKRVASSLFDAMSKNIGLEHGNLSSMFEDGLQIMRMNFYPPCPNPEKVLGIQPHSDSGGLTILLEVGKVHGLQIKRKGGWLPVKPLPGSFIVFISDVTEILCNGKYESVEHRAVINSEEKRMSIAAYHSLKPGDTVGPLPELVEGGEPHYKSMDFHDYMKIIYANKPTGKSNLDRMKL